MKTPCARKMGSALPNKVQSLKVFVLATDTNTVL